MLSSLLTSTGELTVCVFFMVLVSMNMHDQLTVGVHQDSDINIGSFAFSHQIALARKS